MNICEETSSRPFMLFIDLSAYKEKFMKFKELTNQENRLIYNEGTEDSHYLVCMNYLHARKNKIMCKKKG